MNIHEIQKMRALVEAVGAKLAGENKFFTGKLAAKVAKAAEDKPWDATLIGMSNFLRDRSNKSNGSLISRAELKEAYKNFYSYNTSCQEVLAEELGEVVKLAEPTRAKHSADDSDVLKTALAKHANPILLSELSDIFDKKASIRSFNPKTAAQAEENCKRVLPGDPIISIATGRSDVIICVATYKTPKGNSSIFVPVEIFEDNAVLPTVFMHPSGFETIADTTVSACVKKYAGIKFNVDTKDILTAIDMVRGNLSTEAALTDIEKIVIKASLNEPSVDMSAIFSPVDAAVDYSAPEHPLTASFAEMLGTVKGSAEFQFGKSAVVASFKTLLNKLAEEGLTNCNVSIADVEEDKIIFAVSASGSAFKVPVEISNKLPIEPTIVIANGMVKEFTKEALMVVDDKARIAAYNFTSNSNNQLVEILKEAAFGNDLDKAGSALSMIVDSGDEDLTKYAFSVYSDILSGKTVKTASTQKIKTIKIGKNEVCAKTGLPVNKVYVDENGEVQSKYRQDMDQSSPGGSFSHSKLFLAI